MFLVVVERNKNVFTLPLSFQQAPTGVNDTSFESYNLKDCAFPFILRFACQRLLKCLLTSQGNVTDFSGNPCWTVHVSIFNCLRRNKTTK